MRSVNISACELEEIENWMQCRKFSSHCAKIAGVICVERSFSWLQSGVSVSTVIQSSSCSRYPAPSQTTPTVTNFLNCDPQASPQQLETCSCKSNVTALGVLTGLMIALLIAVVTGWLCTFVTMRRRTSKSRTFV